MILAGDFIPMVGDRDLHVFFVRVGETPACSLVRIPLPGRKGMISFMHVWKKAGHLQILVFIFDINVSESDNLVFVF